MMKKLILILALSFSFHTLCAQQKGRKFDKEKFKDALNIEILDKTIFVYTPK